MILKYAVFSNSGEFERYQVDHNISVVQVSAYLSGFDMKVNEADKQVRAGVTTDVSVLVVFRENSEQQAL